jgi:glutamyl-tRNA(Gln) amidotransferase subunit E
MMAKKGTPSKPIKEKTKDTDSYYKKIGFMCGLEIHQRLATSSKLFCSCSTEILERSMKPNYTITRFQRAVAGELGSIDKSAEFEEIRNRSFVYNIFDNNTCIMDIDEEPPHDINTDALGIAFSMACAMNMDIINELQPMRKAVVDGSDPSAFQRTILVAMDGEINVNGLKVKIPLMSLEEESSGIVSSSPSTVTYNTDRLGVPLVEIDTDPNIPDPKSAKEIALYIGTLLRITGMVQRGIGSIRQDVNLSIKDGARVEIKGVQELGLIDQFLENEIKRQQNLLEIKELLIKAKATVGNAVNVTPIFNNTNVEVIKYNINDGMVLSIPLKGFKGLIGREINPNRRLGTEISDYAKMAGVNGIIHSDEDMSKYRFSDQELNKLREQLKITPNDSFIIVAGKPGEAKKAADLAIWRAKYAMEGIPKETRAAHDNDQCTSKFMRPLPTGSRMYPETDVKPIVITDDLRKLAKANAPDVDKTRTYLKSVIKNESLVEQMLLSPRLKLFKIIVEKSKADPEFIANVLIQKLTELKRNGINVDSIKDGSIIEIFGLYANEKITKQAVDEILKIASKDPDNLQSSISKLSLFRIKGTALTELVEKVRKENPGVTNDQLRDKMMSRYRLNVDGAELNRLLEKKK